MPKGPKPLELPGVSFADALRAFAQTPPPAKQAKLKRLPKRSKKGKK
jgi:hypothetical protein